MNNNYLHIEKKHITGGERNQKTYNDENGG